MSAVLDVAKITSKGQVTIPAAVRDLVGVREGERVLFVLMDDGSVSLRSSNLDALHAARRDFAGAAGRAGLRDEDDVVDLVRSVRAGRHGGVS